uniref:Lipoxygenase domain-containing protein n=1 Tax=Oryzias latipes TaxID=8090 RepID=A0A3P9HBU6_ORYLA
MAVVNTYFQKREEHRVTYRSGGRSTQVDYILCRRGHLREVNDCKVVVGESVARQHRMVVCKMTLEVRKKKRGKTEKKTKWWKLQNEETCEEFRQKLRQVLGGQDELPEDWETTAEIIRETGRKVLGVSSGKRKDGKETWWWNEEVQECVQRKRLAKRKWDVERTEEGRQEYKEAQRRVKREVAKAKQKAYDELYDRLDTKEGEKDLYRLARQRDRDGKDVQQIRVIKDRDGKVLTTQERIFLENALLKPICFVMKHWREDAFFGYQFLNGVNPMMIRRCKTLLSKFPVPLDMNFSKSQLTLRNEMMKGNIFLCDYNILDGVETNTINGRKQFLAAPLVLLHKNEDDEMMPIAIQLKQKPGKDNPIFFPTDSEYDWLLAKTYVKSADFNLHELNYHLLRTHLLAEVFAVSLQCNLPRVHPLLIRHTRYTLQINVLARNSLISESGTITLVSELQKISSAFVGHLKSLTLSFCIPDDIADRGLEDVPDFYYRDDGLKLWNIMHRLVVYITLIFYYKNDCMVLKDAELQNWIQEIFENGFLRRGETGIQKFTTMAELVKFVTMVMFTCSVQHAAVNSGQYDLYGWMPNGPSTMQEPLPTHKGKADVTVVTLQNHHALLGRPSFLPAFDRNRYLHDFAEEHFTEDFPKYKVTTFQRDLIKLSEDIKCRNENLDSLRNLFVSTNGEASIKT